MMMERTINVEFHSLLARSSEIGTRKLLQD